MRQKTVLNIRVLNYRPEQKGGRIGMFVEIHWCFPVCAKRGLNTESSAFCGASPASLVMRWGREGARAPGCFSKRWAKLRLGPELLDGLLGSRRPADRIPHRLLRCGRSAAGAWTSPPPSPLRCPLPKQRRHSVSPPGGSFPSSGVGFCRLWCVLLGGESVLKCHGRIYIAARRIRVLIVP